MAKKKAGRKQRRKQQLAPPYRRLFDPSRADGDLAFKVPSRSGDPRTPDEVVYVHSEQTILAVNVALSTGRPLLVKGPPGSGKSTLATHVARKLGWHYFEYVVTSGTRSRDLLWDYDALRRLDDATTKGSALKPISDYIGKGVLWEAFTARKTSKRQARAVVLIDEIDKADPDVPNDLLVALGSLEFEVAETRELVKGTHVPLVVLTSNDERDLPQAFVRRCVLLELQGHGRQGLREICRTHYPEFDEKRLEAILDQVERLRRQAKEQNIRGPSTAEFLDAVFACRELELFPDGDQSQADDAYRDPAANPWASVLHLTLWKHDEPRVDVVGR